LIGYSLGGFHPRHDVLSPNARVEAAERVANQGKLLAIH